MFKKTERLTQAEFSLVFKKGKRHNFAEFTIIIKVHTNRQVGVVVGKKVAKSAVKRNLIKRRIYATLRKYLVTKSTPAVIIVLVKPAYNKLSRQAANSALLQAVAQVLKST